MLQRNAERIAVCSFRLIQLGDEFKPVMMDGILRLASKFSFTASTLERMSSE